MVFETTRTLSIMPRTLISRIRKNMSALMFGVIASKRLLIWKYPNVNHAESGKYTEMTYTSTVHIVIDSAEFFNRSLHHVVHTDFIDDVDLHGYRLKRDVLGKFSALFDNDQNVVLVDVCKDNAFGSDFDKGEGCFFCQCR